MFLHATKWIMKPNWSHRPWQDFQLRETLLILATLALLLLIICLLANVIGQSEVSTKDKKPWPVSTFEPRTIEGLRLRPCASIRRGLGLVHQSAHSRLLPIKRDAIGKNCRRGKPSPTGALLLGKKWSTSENCLLSADHNRYLVHAVTQ